MEQGKFRLEVRKEFFIVRVLRYNHCSNHCAPLLETAEANFIKLPLTMLLAEILADWEHKHHCNRYSSVQHAT